MSYLNISNTYQQEASQALLYASLGAGIAAGGFIGKRLGNLAALSNRGLFHTLNCCRKTTDKQELELKKQDICLICSTSLIGATLGFAATTLSISLLTASYFGE